MIPLRVIFRLFPFFSATLSDKINFIFLISIITLSSCYNKSDKIPNETNEPKSETILDTPNTIYEAAKERASIFKKIEYKNVSTILYIKYDHGLKSGKYLYKTYIIIPDTNEFRIEVTYRGGAKSVFEIPYPLVEQNRNRDTSKIISRMVIDLSFSSHAAHYSSVRKVYGIGSNEYIVYRHIDYNCYDPFCSSKHGHTTHEIGVTYFSPEYGILVRLTDEMQVEVLEKIEGKTVPKDLIIKILEECGVGKGVVWQYGEDVK